MAKLEKDDSSFVVSEAVEPKAYLREREREFVRIRQNRIISVASPVVAILLWELLSRIGILDWRFFSAPSMLGRYFWEAVVSMRVFADLKDTLIRVVIGFALGAGPALIIGIAIGLFSWVRVAIRPIIRATYPIPNVSLLPLVLLVFGIGETSKYVIAAMGAFYNMLLNAAAGVESIEKIYLDVGKNFGANKVRTFTTIAFPAALPAIFAGIRLSWGAALLLIVIVEFVGSSSGIGFLIWRSWQLFSIEPMFLGLFLVGLVGFASYGAINTIQNLVIPWKK